MMPKLSVIIVSYRERDRLSRVLQLLATEFDQADTEVIVVDNDSNDGSAAMVRQQFSWVHLIEPGRNLMYGRGNNLGLSQAGGQWLMILNPDVEWEPDQLRNFVTTAKRLTNIGVAGPQLRFANGRIQHSGHKNFPTAWTVFIEYCLPLHQLLLKLNIHPDEESASAHQHTHQTAHVTGVCLLFPRAIYEKVGGFDESFTMYLEETDWQRRIADAGLDRWFVAENHITHFGSAQKSYSQASPHYFWGLRHYIKQHWRGPGRLARLLFVLWTATLMTDIFLLLAWPISWLLGHGGQRLRYYLGRYVALTARLLHFPNQAPTIS